jgi:hypothetical protein
MDMSKNDKYTRTDLTDLELNWTIEQFDDRILKPLAHLISKSNSEINELND